MATSDPLLGEQEPPADVEVEMALLGALLVRNDLYDTISTVLPTPDSFADFAHQKIYGAIQGLIEAGRQANATTLRRRFEEEETLRDLGGAKYLAELAAGAATVIDAADYARLIRDLYQKRVLIDLSSEIAAKARATDPQIEAKGIVEEAETRLYDLTEHSAGSSGPRDLYAVGGDYVQSAADAMTRGKSDGVMTGIGRIDRATGGFQASDVVVVAGRPGMGKTAFALTVANRCPKPVLFFSMEMSEQQLVARLLSGASSVSYVDVRAGSLDQTQFDALHDAAEKLRGKPFYVDETPAISIPQMRARARRHKRQHGLGLIVVDYLQLMAGGKAENRVQEVSAITRGLKALAKELNVCVIALSQLSRAVEQRDNKRPQLSDLRESGTIEQDADSVIMLYREGYYHAFKEPAEQISPEWDEWSAEADKLAGQAEVILAKNRHGETTAARCGFRERSGQFYDLDSRADDEAYERFL